MDTPSRRRCARWAGWWIQRNPNYLLSAGAMAVGARLYLVDPHTRAGDVGVILLTLGALQLYEWAVTAILLALHRRRRAPEDEPSLLLVAGLFWTGPLAVVTEMTPHHPELGFFMAIGACTIALIEMEIVRRRLGLHLGRYARVVACGCLILLAMAPPMIKVPQAVNWTNELFLYLAWWILAGIALMSAGSVRAHAPGRQCSALPVRAWDDLRTELCFLAIVIGAAAAHLVGMNYAFYGHARGFYASPLLLVLAVVLIQGSTALGRRPPWLTVACTVLPAIAVGLSFQGFDPHVPVHMLPAWLREPSTLLLAGFVLLAAGALISWYKTKLLDLTGGETVIAPPGTAESPT